jgi:hypothetical protein
MNILILNGNPDAGNTPFDAFVNRYQVKLHVMGHYVKVFQLRDMSFSGQADPLGKSAAETPISLADDTRYILNNLADTDLLVLASPLQQGRISSLSTLVQDRIARHYQNIRTKNQLPWDEQDASPLLPMMGFILQTASSPNNQEFLLNKLKLERLVSGMNTITGFTLTLESGVNHAVSQTLRSIDYRLSFENTCNDIISGTSPALNAV